MIENFKQKLMEFDNEFLLKAYEEIQILDNEGAFPPNPEYFRELANIRSKLYDIEYDIDTTKKDIIEEIARRWYIDNK